MSASEVVFCRPELADSVLTVLVNVAGVMDGDIPDTVKQQVHSVIAAAILGTGEPAEKPVVPVSEDMETIRRAIYSIDAAFPVGSALAALARLAAAAGRNGDASRCAP